MTQLTGKAIATVDELSVDNNARAYACAEGDDDEVLHTTGYTIYHLTDGSSIGIIGQCHGNAQPLFEHLGQRHNAIVAPLKVGSKLDGAAIVVTVGSSDTHGLDLVDAAALLNNRLQGSYTSVYILLGRGIALRLDGCCGLDFATAVNDTEDGVSSTQIETDDIRFQ